MTVETHTAGALARMGALTLEMTCPVSGPRCRCCGVRAERCPPAERWAVIHGAAYCLGCTPDELLPRERKDGA